MRERESSAAGSSGWKRNGSESAVFLIAAQTAMQTHIERVHIATVASRDAPPYFLLLAPANAAAAAAACIGLASLSLFCPPSPLRGAAPNTRSFIPSFCFISHRSLCSFSACACRGARALLIRGLAYSFPLRLCSLALLLSRSISLQVLANVLLKYTCLSIFQTDFSI